LKRFREGKFSVLVATDVASRGLDIPNVDLVIQVEPPKEVETYIHRSGRTARAGKVGTCITFYTMKHKPMIEVIEKRAGIKFKKIGIPQPEDVIKASSRDIIKNMKKDGKWSDTNSVYSLPKIKVMKFKVKKEKPTAADAKAAGEAPGAGEAKAPEKKAEKKSEKKEK